MAVMEPTIDNPEEYSVRVSPMLDSDSQERILIGFVHSYHPGSRFVEMEIVPTLATAQGVEETRYIMASAMVDDGSESSDVEFKHARPEQQATANAASALVEAVEAKEGKEGMIVPLVLCCHKEFA